MILRKRRAGITSITPSTLRPELFTSSPEPSPCPSIIFSEFSGETSNASDSDDAMSDSHSTHTSSVRSRPRSSIISSTFNPSQPPERFTAQGPYCPRVPTLSEILLNTAPPPWTLSAFTAYLSQKQCLENLEFTTDARRYQRKYDDLCADYAGSPLSHEFADCDDIRRLWQKLVNAYINVGSPKEVNLPAAVRDGILDLPDHSIPPSGEELEGAIKHIEELMGESILMPFITDMAPRQPPEPRSHGGSAHGSHVSASTWTAAGAEDVEMRDSDDEHIPISVIDRSGDRVDSRSHHSLRFSIDHSRQRSRSTHSRLRLNPPSIYRESLRDSASGGSGPAGGGGGLNFSSDLVLLTDPTTTHAMSSMSRASEDQRSLGSRGSIGSPSSPSGSTGMMMTPPTTPPSSDIVPSGGGSGSSPQGGSGSGGAMQSNPWRKMMEKLGTAKKRSASKINR